MDGSNASINITDQVPTISQSNTIVNGVQTITTTITTQAAGVTVSLTPQIFNDGAVVLNLQPTVSQPIRTVEATNNGATTSTVLLASRSMNLAGVRVQDGSTLVIGGLLRESSQMDIRRVPGMDKLPIVSAMFRSLNRNDADRTELVLMVTPHILKEEATTYSENAQSGKFKNMNQGQGGIQPVSLPKFIGPLSSSELQAAPSESSKDDKSADGKKQASASAAGPMMAVPATGKLSEGKMDKQASKVMKPGPSVAETAKSLLVPKVESMPTAAGVIQLQRQDAFKQGQTIPVTANGKGATTPDAKPVSSVSKRTSGGGLEGRLMPLQALDEILKD
jgi:hypothetical protein